MGDDWGGKLSVIEGSLPAKDREIYDYVKRIAEGVDRLEQRMNEQDKEIASLARQLDKLEVVATPDKNSALRTEERLNALEKEVAVLRAAAGGASGRFFRAPAGESGGKKEFDWRILGAIITGVVVAVGALGAVFGKLFLKE